MKTTELNDTLFEEKSFEFQPLTSDIRYIGIEEVWSGICVGEFNCGSQWYTDELYRNLYDRYCLSFNLEFYNNDTPKRCRKAVSFLTEEIYSYLKQSRKWVSKSKVKIVAKCIVKNISRLNYFKQTKLGLKYIRDENKFKDINVSYTYLIEAIDMLSNLGYLYNFIGFISEGEDCVSSMLVPTQEFMNLCIGKKIPEQMEDSLRSSIDELILIRDRVDIVGDDGKIHHIKKQRPFKRGEKMEANALEEAMRVYNEELRDHVIYVNDIKIPEIMFRRIFVNSMQTGGRFVSDGGIIQSESKSVRATTTIDYEPTTSCDFDHLHPSMLYLKKGIDISDFDPYACDTEFDIDELAIKQYKDIYGIEKYDPVRNICKKALLTMINSRNRESCIKALAKEYRDDFHKQDPSQRKFVGLSIKNKLNELVDSIAEHNKEIAEYFFSDTGIVLQKYDSDIMQLCVDHFDSINEVCFPIHDCLIVKRKHQQLAISTMEAAYIEVMGSDLNCRISVEY